MLEKFKYLNTVGELLKDIGKCSDAPETKGVYVVVYKKSGMPDFKDPGSGPEPWRKRITNVSVEKLISKWVTFKDGEEQIIYIGKAGGDCTGANLRGRIKQYILFGLGHNIAHYGGRYIWQIANPGDMGVYWKEDDEPSETERKLLKYFKHGHEGKLPFANLIGGNVTGISKIISNSIFTRGLVLPKNSVHGLCHWKRVEKFGLKIAKENAADKNVISLFAYLHDARRENEDDDPDHGVRAAVLLKELVEAKLVSLTPRQFEQLIKALSLHNKHNAESDDITIQTCWDADRLDLWRYGFVPNPKLMFTDYGKSKKMIEYAKKLNRI
ncbi:MAG: hypothetical protein WC467_02445 [Patescibacteria group bacterium]